MDILFFSKIKEVINGHGSFVILKERLVSLKKHYSILADKSVQQKCMVALLVLSIASTAFLMYAYVLGYFFTGGDTLSLIDSSRIRSLKDVLGIFTLPLFGKAYFAVFYRPVASLSFSLDYYLWGLNPFGYHLTDLMLHIMASILVFAVMFHLTRGRKALSWLSAIIFTTHPIVGEIVPVIERRQDLLPTVFMLLSFVLFLNHVSVSTRRGNWRLLASLFAYALALGAKELAILLPFIICAYLFVFPSCAQGGGGKRKSLRTGAFQQIKICLPYFVVTAIYIVWRSYVLGGIGGYPSPPFPPYSLALFCQITAGYFSTLLFLLPLDIETVSPFTVLMGAVCVLFVLLVFLFRKREIILINMRLLCGTQAGKIAIFLFIWLLLPVGFFWTTRTFFFRLMYFPAIPFSAILSITIIEGFRLFMRRAATQQTMANTRWLPYAGAALFIIASGMAIYLLCSAPIAKTDKERKHRGEISRVLLYKLSKVVANLPDKATDSIHTYTLHIYDLPAVTPTFSHRFFPSKPFTVTDSIIKAYLHLTNPDIQMEVSIESRKVTTSFPANFDLEVAMQPNNEIIATYKTR